MQSDPRHKSCCRTNAVELTLMNSIGSSIGQTGAILAVQEDKAMGLTLYSAAFHTCSRVCFKRSFQTSVGSFSM